MTPAELAALHAVCFDTPRPYSEAEFTDFLDTPQCFLCSVPHGFSLGRVIADEAELLTLAIDPNHRNLGFGRNALAAFETQAIVKYATSAFLEVAANNAPARALYLAGGYGESGFRAGYYRAPDGAKIDAILMSKQLNPDEPSVSCR